jgi:hypothetical protein
MLSMPPERKKPRREGWASVVAAGSCEGSADAAAQLQLEQGALPEWAAGCSSVVKVVLQVERRMARLSR